MQSRARCVMKTRILVIASMIVAFAAPAHAQLRDGRENPLTAARDLYASARYDEALAVLNGLPSDAVASDRKSIEQYRSLCLLALGRGTEAESAIAAGGTADPSYLPGEGEAAPGGGAALTAPRKWTRGPAWPPLSPTPASPCCPTSQTAATAKPRPCSIARTTR